MEKEDPALAQRIIWPRYKRSYCGSWNSIRKFLCGENLTDGEWERIKRAFLKAAYRSDEKDAKQELARKQRKQQRTLRERYDTFLAALDDRARPFIPLFLDFLLLPSIQALWQPGEEISDAAWEAAQPSLQEDLNDYRLKTCLRARRLILSATQGDDGGQDEDKEDEVTAITDKFFLRVDSFVCCGVAGCPGKSRPTGYYRGVQWHWPDDPRQDWIGALPDVLAHQHKFHNSETSFLTKASAVLIPNLESHCRSKSPAGCLRFSSFTASMANQQRNATWNAAARRLEMMTRKARAEGRSEDACRNACA